MKPLIKKIISGELTREGDVKGAGGFVDEALIILLAEKSKGDGWDAVCLPKEIQDRLQHSVFSALWEVYEETRRRSLTCESCKTENKRNLTCCPSCVPNPSYSQAEVEQLIRATQPKMKVGKLKGKK